MHQPAAPAADGMKPQVEVDPLRVPRGHRALPRGGVHATPRRPNRSKGKRLLRKQMDREEVR